MYSGICFSVVQYNGIMLTKVISSLSRIPLGPWLLPLSPAQGLMFAFIPERALVSLYQITVNTIKKEYHCLSWNQCSSQCASKWRLEVQGKYFKINKIFLKKLQTGTNLVLNIVFTRFTGIYHNLRSLSGKSTVLRD